MHSIEMSSNQADNVPPENMLNSKCHHEHIHILS